ncbi:MAG: D-2-hydroxyacid dehydrogenase family protein [Pontibacterium sp.]
MKIAILDDYQDQVRHLPCFDLLAGHSVEVFNETYDEDTLVEKLKDVEALVLIRERTAITDTLLARLPQLKVISQTGKVSNHIDPEECKAHGVEILEGRGSPVAPTELGWALIMAASRHLPAYISAFNQGQWQQSGERGLGRVLNGLTLGIWGYGKIGQRMAQIAHVFGMKVLVWGSESSRALAVSHGFMAAESKADFFATADVLSLHLRLNSATKGVVTAEDFAHIKADALFVNISRAELVEPGALLAWLKANPKAQAALDVYEQEPATPTREPLLQLPNVVATPHLGYVEQKSYELYFEIAFKNLVEFVAR